MNRFRNRLGTLVALVAAVTVTANVVGGSSDTVAEKTKVEARPTRPRPATKAPVRPLQAFPDFKLDGKPPESQYSGKLFRLSQEFPEDPVDVSDDPAVAEILKIPYDQNDREKNWLRYLNAVRDYCFQGNIDARESPPDAAYAEDWQREATFNNWFHVPWQHWGDKGREGIHGMTREASARPGQLGPEQVQVHDTHAVAVYNRIGGYTIGQVWKNQFEPNLQASVFRPGTVVAKVLFTQAGEDEVPYLHDGLVWQAYVREPKDPTKKKVQNLRLLQMDIMVRDPRADKTGGWVFGTYCYNGSVKEPNKWRRLVPVGIQWGNDPDFADWQANRKHTSPFPTHRGSQKHLKETIINDSADLPPQHLGWGGRLNGPADYYRSSCASCHATAQYPGHSPQHPDFKALGHEPGGKDWMLWFRNLPCGQAFEVGTPGKKQAITTDFSLQMQIGIANFYEWKSTVMGGYFTFRDDTHEVLSEPAN